MDMVIPNREIYRIDIRHPFLQSRLGVEMCSIHTQSRLVNLTPKIPLFAGEWSPDESRHRNMAPIFIHQRWPTTEAGTPLYQFPYEFIVHDKDATEQAQLHHLPTTQVSFIIHPPTSIRNGSGHAMSSSSFSSSNVRPAQSQLQGRTEMDDDDNKEEMMIQPPSSSLSHVNANPLDDRAPHHATTIEQQPIDPRQVTTHTNQDAMVQVLEETETEVKQEDEPMDTLNTTIERSNEADGNVGGVVDGDDEDEEEEDADVDMEDSTSQSYAHEQQGIANPSDEDKEGDASSSEDDDDDDHDGAVADETNEHKGETTEANQAAPHDTQLIQQPQQTSVTCADEEGSPEWEDDDALSADERLKLLINSQIERCHGETSTWESLFAPADNEDVYHSLLPSSSHTYIQSFSSHHLDCFFHAIAFIFGRSVEQVKSDIVQIVDTLTSTHLKSNHRGVSYALRAITLKREHGCVHAECTTREPDGKFSWKQCKKEGMADVDAGRVMDPSGGGITERRLIDSLRTIITSNEHYGGGDEGVILSHWSCAKHIVSDAPTLSPVNARSLNDMINAVATSVPSSSSSSSSTISHPYDSVRVWTLNLKSRKLTSLIYPCDAPNDAKVSKSVYLAHIGVGSDTDKGNHYALIWRARPDANGVMRAHYIFDGATFDDARRFAEEIGYPQAPTSPWADSDIEEGDHVWTSHDTSAQRRRKQPMQIQHLALSHHGS